MIVPGSHVATNDASGFQLYVSLDAGNPDASSHSFMSGIVIAVDGYMLTKDWAFVLDNASLTYGWIPVNVLREVECSHPE